MGINPATALAHPNIALIKYWGDRVPDLHIPVNGSISMNLEELYSRTTVVFDPAFTSDMLILNGDNLHGDAAERVTSFLDRVREMAGIKLHARVESENNFPTSAGLASSASGFAALSLATSKAAGLGLDETGLSRLARTGSGSACRSIPGGFVEWQAGEDDANSYGFSIAPPEYWGLVDCIALVSHAEKSISSAFGHAVAHTSPLQKARVADTPSRLAQCRQAILARDFERLAMVVELDSNMMHAVMLTSTPPLPYGQPVTLELQKLVHGWRKNGLPACSTVDAGPNVHVLCPMEYGDEVVARLRQVAGVIEVLVARPGGPAHLVDA